MSNNIKGYENLQQQITAQNTIQQQILDTKKQFQDNNQINRIFQKEFEPFFNQPTNILQNDLTQMKKCNKKQPKIVQDKFKASYQEQIDEKIQPLKQSIKTRCQHIDEHFFHSQEIMVNQQFKNNIQIYLRKVLINDGNIRSEFFNEIFGNLDQVDSTVDEEKLKMFTSLSLNLNNRLDFRKHQTVQKIYLHQNGTYSVSVKTCISEDNQKFIVQKMITEDSQQHSQQFESSVQIEIDNLNYIEQKKTQVTLPFIKHQFLKFEFGQKCVLSIVSGIKNLEQVKKYYQSNKRYEEYNTILEFAFCQLLSKLNQMHRICQIAHSDIKPQNIVVGYDLQFYFIDFGASIYLEDKEQFQYYLQSFSKNYNLDIFIEKRKKKEWKYLEIIDCDTSQLILTFLKMFDVEDNYYKELRDFRIQNKNECKQLLMPEFKRLGNYLIDSLWYIYQNHSNQLFSKLESPKQKLFLFSNFGDYFKMAMSNLHDIIYDDSKQQYMIKSINMFSIQILELIIQNDQSCNFLINEITNIDEQINYNETKIDQRNIDKYPNFCKYFQLKENDIIFFGLTNYNFNNKGKFILILLFEYQLEIPLFQLQNPVLKNLIEQMNLDIVHIYFQDNYDFIKREQSMEFKIIKKINNLLQISLLSQEKNFYITVIKDLIQKVKSQNDLKVIILSFNMPTFEVFQQQLLELSEVCQELDKKLLLQFILKEVDELFENQMNFILKNLNIYFAINIKQQIEKFDLIKLLQNEALINYCTLIKAKDFGQSLLDQRIKINEQDFKINQMNEEIYYLENYSLNNQCDLFDHFNRVLKDFSFSVNIFEQEINQKQKVVQDMSSVRTNQQFFDEEIQSLIQPTKNDLQLLSKQLLHSQEIIINEQFKNNVQFYLRKNLIQDENKRKIFLSLIIGKVDQTESLGCEKKNNRYAYHYLQIMIGTYSVSVKTCISEDNQQLIVQKTVANVNVIQCDSQQFKNRFQSEIDNLNYIQSKKLKCILSIESGIKNLEQVKKYYQSNKKYEEFNTILEFSFCQLLSKLNQMHRAFQIAHSDIKPQNIVVGYDLQFYFIDFGASIYLEDKEQFQYYMQSYSVSQNLDIFIEKREKKEWKYLEIIDCDTSQLILTFLKMLDVEDNYSLPAAPEVLNPHIQDNLKASYQELIDEEIQLLKQSQSTKNRSQLLNGDFFHSQETMVNQQFKNNIQIYLRKVLINDDNIRSQIFNEIFVNLDQFDSNTVDEEKLKIFRPFSFNLNNHLDFRKHQTIQKFYQHQSGTYYFSVKTCISDDNQKFIVQKRLLRTLNKILNSFRASEFFKGQFGQEKCVLRIVSGIKNLEYAKKYYQSNKKQHYFRICPCQLLSKLNQIHRICQITHSNIKPQNIVVGYDLQFYFIDFGASVYLEDLNSCKKYLQSYTKHYNFNIFLEKTEWKYQKSIDCDTLQLILTFLKIFQLCQLPNSSQSSSLCSSNTKVFNSTDYTCKCQYGYEETNKTDCIQIQQPYSQQHLIFKNVIQDISYYMQLIQALIPIFPHLQYSFMLQQQIRVI
ncbi:hypothetical protein ABPG72_003344 [Tetrahymena utriculariae]